LSEPSPAPVPARVGQRPRAAEGGSRAVIRPTEHRVGEAHPSKRPHERPTLISSTIQLTHCHRDLTFRLALRTRCMCRCAAHLRTFIACPAQRRHPWLEWYIWTNIYCSIGM